MLQMNARHGTIDRSIGENQMKRHSYLHLVVAGLLIVVAPRFLMAATYTWSGASGTDLSWQTPGNWSPAGPPGTFDDANFSDLGSTNALGQPSSIATVN